MSLMTNQGIASLMASRVHHTHAMGLLKTMNQLATGLRINRGADDPAGLIISERLRSMLESIDAESRAPERTNQVANRAEGALQEVSSLLSEAESLLVANANSAGLSEEEKQANQLQLDSILSSINHIAGSTTFNGRPLLDGSLTLSANGQSLQIQSTAAHNLGNVQIDGESFSLADLGSGGALNSADGDLDAAQQVLAAARDQVSTMRGRIGAFQTHAIDSRLSTLSTSMENVSAAQSFIRDTQYAFETSNLTRLMLLQRSSLRTMQLMNLQAQSVLDLLS